MVNYGNGKIYKIWSPSHPELVYYGSTTQALSKRMAEHRDKLNSTSKDILIYDDAKIELVEDFPCERKEQLLAREGYFIKENNCVNKNIAGRTRAEYYIDNKDTINKYNLEYGKQFYKTEYGKDISHKNCKLYAERHKEELKAKRAQYYLDNRERLKEKQRVYNKNNRE